MKINAVTFLFVAVVLAGCAGYGAAPEPSGRLLRVLNPVSGEPIFQMSLANAVTCRVMLDELVAGKNGKLMAGLSSCTDSDASAVLAYRATLVHIESGLSATVKAGTVELCDIMAASFDTTLRDFRVEEPCARN